MQPGRTGTTAAPKNTQGEAGRRRDHTGPRERAEVPHPNHPTSGPADAERTQRGRAHPHPRNRREPPQQARDGALRADADRHLPRAGRSREGAQLAVLAARARLQSDPDFGRLEVDVAGAEFDAS